LQPNIYLCSTGYSCCTVYGYHSCCASDISLEADANNIVLYTVIAISALFVALAVQCYFEDFDPSDSDIADNTGDLDNANNIVLYTVIAISALFVALAVQCYFEDFDPSDSDIADNTGDLDKIYDEKETSKLVEDPIFGIVPYETPPPYAFLIFY
ncbi:hypothetical protein Tcan_17801, partial [Toxocara canis]